MQNAVNKKDPVCIDHLDEDEPISRQRFVCLSFITPEKVKGAKHSMVKVRGVYETMKEAETRCEELTKVDPYFDVFVGEVGKWGLITNDPEKAQNVAYQEDEMQKLAEGYKKNLNETKKMEKQRKMDLLREGDYDKTDRRSDKKAEIAARMKKKLEEKKLKKQLLEEAKDKLEETDTNLVLKEHTEKMVSKEKQLNDLEEEINEKKELSKEESERLKQTDNLVKEKEKEVKDVNKNIKKIEKLYKKLKEKQAQKSAQNSA
uniref:Uncharacterized protein n=1 Tax=viral metagenome TaxID=1070528 RepID=A0A6C0ACL0_9ZZZZ